jgi:Flp pilus assembly protein TadG
VRTPSLTRPGRLTHFLRRFARAERGVTAVEFGLISLPLLLMTFGILEIALVFMVSAALDTATEQASRQIRTGEFQTSAAKAQADFKNLVCSRMSWLSSQCAANLWIDVQTFATFNGLANAPPIDAATFKPPAGLCFSPGLPTDIVLVRANFVWSLLTPGLNAALENMGGGSGKRLITSTTAFRNEPYNFTPPEGTKC